jgi:hypothetical protein
LRYPGGDVTRRLHPAPSLGERGKVDPRRKGRSETRRLVRDATSAGVSRAARQREGTGARRRGPFCPRLTPWPARRRRSSSACAPTPTWLAAPCPLTPPSSPRSSRFLFASGLETGPAAVLSHRRRDGAARAPGHLRHWQAADVGFVSRPIA